MADVNRIKRAWSSDRPAFGLWCAIPDPFAVEQAAALGLDYVCLDQQHGLIDYAAMVAMIRAAGAAGCAPIVRVASNEPWLLMHALDAGALGVLVPMVDDRAQAARAVKSKLASGQGSNLSRAIRRAVEMLSEHIVEQVAWEVVPQLAELLIKRRLEEERSQTK
jgi:4-hydroxy-2-oxoheptanedioate aldolase